MFQDKTHGISQLIQPKFSNLGWIQVQKLNDSAGSGRDLEIDGSISIKDIICTSKRTSNFLIAACFHLCNNINQHCITHWETEIKYSAHRGVATVSGTS